jgi:hypothetical protein
MVARPIEIRIRRALPVPMGPLSMLCSDIDRRCRRQLGAQAGDELGSAGARQRPGVGPGKAAEADIDAEGLPDGATRSPTESASAKDRRKYDDPGEQEQEEGGNVPEGG